MCLHWVHNGPWYNVTIYPILCSVIFEDFHATEIQDIYELIYVFDTHKMEHDQCSVSIISGRGRTFMNTYTPKALHMYGNTVNFIEF